jgi:hypothetical protein
MGASSEPSERIRGATRDDVEHPGAARLPCARKFHAAYRAHEDWERSMTGDADAQ